jgi:L-threonylcarbamoyladenylate synthase
LRAVEPTLENVAMAAAMLAKGGLVVVPTETVYGVAADATNPKAVARLYEAKGRPRENPLIVHIACLDDLERIASHVSPDARRLAERFWPGPLTMVLPKSDLIPDIVTAGLPTVAVRYPKHPVAASLITLTGKPLAMPSANPFQRLSPTRVEHLDPELLAKTDLVLDGGPCVVGLESTVVDLVEDPPKVLRPGAVTRGEIQAAIGRPLGTVPPGGSKGPRRSPGTYPRHYAPHAPLVLVDRAPEGSFALVFGEPSGPNQIRMPKDPGPYGASLYAALHTLDARRPEAIYVERPPATAHWDAVRDRLERAAAPE